MGSKASKVHTHEEYETRIVLVAQPQSGFEYLAVRQVPKWGKV